MDEKAVVVIENEKRRERMGGDTKNTLLGG